MAGVLLSFEGGEGCGKTTQIELLAGVLRERGHEVVITREPGGTPLGLALRQILLNPELKQELKQQAAAPLAAKAELLLMLADRAQHIQTVIAPSLQAGQIVLCDRFADSTTAYQGHGRGFDLAEIARLNAFVCGACMPQLTFVLDLPVTVGLRRAQERRGTAAVDHFEAESVAFHKRVRSGFLQIARAEPERVCILDANQSIDVVQRAILEKVQKRLPTLAPLLLHPAQPEE
jgi:dTMP kinase